MMKQYKAIDKKTGQLKKTEALCIVSIFPEQFTEKIKTKFEECYEKHHGEIKKEQNGAASWIPFTKCFYEYSQSVRHTKTCILNLPGNQLTLHSISHLYSSVPRRNKHQFTT